MVLSALPFPLRVTALDRPLVFSELRTIDARLSEPEFNAMRLSVRSLVAREDRFTAFRVFSAVPYLVLSSFFPTLSDPFRATLEVRVLVRSTRGMDFPFRALVLLTEEFSAYLAGLLSLWEFRWLPADCERLFRLLLTDSLATTRWSFR